MSMAVDTIALTYRTLGASVWKHGVDIALLVYTLTNKQIEPVAIVTGFYLPETLANMENMKNKVGTVGTFLVF